MGITNLNNITKEDGAQTFNDNKFDTIIVDGSNMISVLIFGCKNSLVDEKDPSFILGELVNGVYGMFVAKIRDLKRKYNNNEIIITFDTTKKLNYTLKRRWIIDESGNIIVNPQEEFLIKQFKEEERELRKLQKSKPKARNAFVDNDSNILSIIPLVISMIVDTYKTDDTITIIQTEDEADFVIRNLSIFYSTFRDSILVVSEDTDYFVLLCDIPKAYKTGARQDTFGIIYSPKQLFENCLGTSNYLEVMFVALFAGCDYTIHTMLLSMERVNNYKLLYNNPTALHNNKRLKFVKENYLPANLQVHEHKVDTFIEIIQHFVPELKVKMVDLMNLYYSWCFINKFSYFDLDVEDEYNKLINRFNLQYLQTIKYNKLQRLIPKEEPEIIYTDDVPILLD